MGRDRTAAKALVLAKGNALEALDQPHANAVDDVLRKPGEQPRLQDVEHERRGPQQQGYAKHQADVAGRTFPAGGQKAIHHAQRRIAGAEQHFVY